ncbi:MAG: TonB-dependent receptor plug domain-containing protein [Chitinophagaceae bacterium]
MSKFSLVVFILCISLAGTSQVLPREHEDTITQLAEVVITANKYFKKQSETGKVITVIDQQLLRQMGSRTLGEVLNTVSGVTINGANNNLGTNQGISIRGAAFGNALVLIDGIPVNDPSVISNYFDINFIHPDDIEKIEILKGGQSTLYGSDAVAGVINIITKKANDNPFAFNASLSAGSYNTFKVTAGINGRANKFSYKLQQTAIRSAGFSSAHDSTGSASFDNDSYKQNMVDGRLVYAFNPSLLFNVTGMYSRYKTEIDAAAFTDDNDFSATNKNYQAGIGFNLKNRGNVLFNYHFNYLDRLYLDDSADRGNSFAYYSRSKYIGRTHFAELYQTLKWTNWELLAGADYRYNNTNQRFFSVGSFGPFETSLNDSAAHSSQLSPYASVAYNNNQFNVELGGRYNFHSEYGTYTFNPSYLFNNKLKLFANISSAFKAPSLYQLYDAYAGNNDLEPETATIIEGGAAIYYRNNVGLRLTYFHRKTDNAIQYIIVNPATFEAKYQNINKQENNGIEAELKGHWNKWSVHANYTYTKARITSSHGESGFALGKDTSYNNLYRVPKHAFNTFVSFQVSDKLTFSTLIKIIGKRYEPVYLSVPKELDSYHTIDFSTSYSLNKKLRVFADLKNITNQQYFDIIGYNSRGFNFTAGITLQL